MYIERLNETEVVLLNGLFESGATSRKQSMTLDEIADLNLIDLSPDTIRTYLVGMEGKGVLYTGKRRVPCPSNTWRNFSVSSSRSLPQDKVKLSVKTSVKNTFYVRPEVCKHLQTE